MNEDKINFHLIDHYLYWSEMESEIEEEERDREEEEVRSLFLEIAQENPLEVLIAARDLGILGF